MKGGNNMNREQLQEEIRFLYGLWYRYFNLYHSLKKNKKGLELIPKLRERQMEKIKKSLKTQNKKQKKC